MSLNECQNDVEQWTSQFKIQYWPPHQILGHMTEELGEIARNVSYLHGIKKPKNLEETKGSLGEELADLLFATVCMANSHGINLETEWKKMMEEKRYKRDNDRFEKSKKFSTQAVSLFGPHN